jgi:GT2 family glycosyltransferase
VFPTNNGLVRRSALAASGLFDPAFDSGARADFELGLRLTSSGALLVLDPAACVVHLRAPRGGLRHHGARTRTYAGSRASLWMRQLPEPTELYLWRRFFSPFQAREALVLRVAGTFAAHGAWWRRCAKIVLGLLLLPATLLGIRFARRRADQLLAMQTTPDRFGAEVRVP